MIIMLCHSIILANGENNNNYVGIKRQNNGNVCHTVISLCVQFLTELNGTGIYSNAGRNAVCYK